MRKRFFRAAIVSIVAGLLIAFIFAVPLMDQIYTDEVQERLTTALALSVGYADEQTDCQTLATYLGQQLHESGQDIRLTILDEQGQVLGDSEADPIQMGNHADRPEVQEALKSGMGRHVRWSETTGVRQMYLAQTVETPEGIRIYRMSIPMNGLGQVQVMLWCCAGIGIFMGLVVALFSAHYAAGRLMEPLHALIRAVRSIAEGDVSVHVEDAPDEMGELSGAVNRMSERLANAQMCLEQSNDQLAGILQGMDDGVVAVGPEGNITLMTNRAR